MSNNDTPATAAEDLTKGLAALNLRQESGKEKTAKANNAPREPRAFRNARNQKQPPPVNDSANKGSANQQDWRARAQPPGRSGPNVTTRSQTNAARAQQPRRDRQEPKQFPLPRPKPTVAYLQQALQPPKLSDKPRQLLVILDLNGTLVHRVSRQANSKFTKRPFCEKFMQ